MAATTEITFRLTPEDKALIKQGADLEGTSVSTFLRLAALERLRELMRALEPPAPTTIAPDLFDQMMASIDQPDHVQADVRNRFARAKQTLETLQLR